MLEHLQSSAVPVATRSGLFLPPFDELSDPLLVAKLAAEAEEAGWDGIFLWDHVRWNEPVEAVADTQVTLAAIATATERLRFGPMITPLARRRPVKVAREATTLDQLSRGRLTLGVGAGSDEFGGEFVRTGDETNARRRGQMLDESLDILQAAWSGETVRHSGEHYTVDGIRFLPRPLQRPGVPIWVAGTAGKRRPLERAIRYQGSFPRLFKDAEQFEQIVNEVSAARAVAGYDAAEPYDYVAALAPGADPTPFIAAGATWWLVRFSWEGLSADLVRGVIREGPARR